jgi:hypothetical protein
MAFVLRQSIRSLQTRAASACRVHTCVRCQSNVISSEPCSFVPEMIQVCPSCAAQEHALRHLPTSRSVWGAGLARRHRG